MRRYAHVHYTESEPWGNGGRDTYQSLCSKYRASYLPSPYEKVKVEVDPMEEEFKASFD